MLPGVGGAIVAATAVPEAATTVCADTEAGVDADVRAAHAALLVKAAQSSAEMKTARARHCNRNAVRTRCGAPVSGWSAW
jgi:hypothetical protein